jgi:hypothetical protein
MEVSVLNVDRSIGSSDWIKSNSWSFTEIQTLEDLITKLGLLEKDETAQVDGINRFMKLPSSIPMPDSLRKEVYQFIGETLPNPKFLTMVAWCLEAVDRFFPEESQKIIAVYKKIKQSGASFLDDIDFEEQAILMDIQTRDIPDNRYPKSPLMVELDQAAKLRK